MVPTTEERHGAQDLLRDPLADLPPTARRMIEVTQQLLVKKGYTAVTLEAIGEACGLKKVAVKYYFGNKAGLMTTLIDSLVYQSCAVVAELVKEPLEDEQRLHAFLDAKRKWSESDSQFAFVELLPHVLRNAAQRERLVLMYERLIADYMRFFGAYVPGASEEEARGLAQLVIGVVDGVAVQYRMSRERFASPRPFLVLEAALAVWLNERRSEAAQCLASRNPSSR